MRRNSDEAQKIVALCDGMVSGRQLETWSREGLTWPDGASDEQKRGRIRSLRGLTGRRKSHDDAALALAAQGYPNRRHRDVLLKVFDEAVVAEALDPENGEHFDFIEQTASLYMSDGFSLLSDGDLSPALRAIGQHLALVFDRNIEAATRRLSEDRDPWTPPNTPETAETVAHAFAVNMLHAACVEEGGIYALEVVGAIIGADLRGDEGFRHALEHSARHGPSDARRLVTDASLEELSQMAVILRQMSNEPGYDLGMDATQLDVFWGLYAPLTFAMARHALDAMPDSLPEHAAKPYPANVLGLLSDLVDPCENGPGRSELSE